MKTFILLLTLALLSAPAFAAETTRRVQVAWDAAPADEAITSYRLSVNSVPQDLPGNANSATVDAPTVKTTFELVAINAAGESTPATYTLVAVPGTPKGFKVAVVKVTVTTSKTTTSKPK